MCDIRPIKNVIDKTFVVSLSITTVSIKPRKTIIGSYLLYAGRCQRCLVNQIQHVADLSNID